MPKKKLRKIMPDEEKSSMDSFREYLNKAKGPMMKAKELEDTVNKIKMAPDKMMETYLPYEDRELRPYEKPMKKMEEMIPPYKNAKKPMEKIEKVLPYETALPKKNLKKMMKK
jgi:hypothetical protein